MLNKLKKLKRNRPKVFCIGENKTGTTSMEAFLKDHDFNLGNQREAELLIDYYINRDWGPIINYCKKYEAFQDIPFSCRFTYVVMDTYFSNSKFILTVRDSPEQWYNSITKFHAKLFGNNGNVPTKIDLQNGNYISRGWIWKVLSEKYGNYEDPYNKERLIKYYLDYNQEVRTYFRDKNNFLEINVSAPDASKKLADFLGITPKYDVFPHKNKTSDRK